MLTTVKALLTEARQQRYAVGAFEFWSLDAVKAVLEAAEEWNAPVILQATMTEINYMGWKNIERAVAYTADQSSARVALHLDHSTEIAWIKMAIDSGFTGVMIDASRLCFEENAAITHEVVALAAPHNVSVEAELGRIIGQEGALSVAEAEAFHTDPAEAARFIAQTGADCLAVAVGTAHGFYRYTPKVNIDRIHAIREAVPVPLVLHGGSGTPDEQVVAAIEAGISKINVCTDFMNAFAKAYVSGTSPSVKGLFEPGYLAGKAVVKEKIKLFGRLDNAQ